MNWLDYNVAQEYHADLLREAHKQRLLRSLFQQQPSVAFYAPALARLGRWLIAWGWRLRARYGEVEFSVVSDKGR